jgi:SAM-dependent methyltransferase
MRDEGNPHKFGRRRNTTRRLLRHPARLREGGLPDGQAETPDPTDTASQPTAAPPLDAAWALPPTAAAVVDSSAAAPVAVPANDATEPASLAVEPAALPSDAPAPVRGEGSSSDRPPDAAAVALAPHDVIDAAVSGGDPTLDEEERTSEHARPDAVSGKVESRDRAQAPLIAPPPLANSPIGRDRGASTDLALARSGQNEPVAKDERHERDGSTTEHGADYEAKTKPKIRLPDGGVRRPSPRPVPRSGPPGARSSEPAGPLGARSSEPAGPPGARSSEPAGPLGARSSEPAGPAVRSSEPAGPLGARGSEPAGPSGARNGEPIAASVARTSEPARPNSAPPLRRPSPLPPVRDAARAAVPTGEGIIRSTPPPRSSADNDRESDVPTRPRIPLTPDMARAAGRITSIDADGDESALAAFGGGPSSEFESAPTVVVTRARVISDRPAPPEQTLELPARRPSRRSRPDSEEFETLDLDEGDEETGRFAIAEGEGASALGLEAGLRVTRTPPPPPAQPSAKRAAAPAGPNPQRGAPPPPPPSVTGKKPPAAGGKTPKKKRAWWEVLFSDDYVHTLVKLSPAQLTKQVNFMESSLGIKRGDAVLDVGCGLGQHALEFARRGYLVVALDLALSMITRAAEDAQHNGLRINFLHKDIRDIGFEGTFDAIICVGTTFGFFDDEQNRGVLARLAHALKPGGRLLLDVVNRDHVIGSQPNLVWFEGDGCVVMEESDFNFYSSRLNVKRTMMREDGRQNESEYSIRLYSVHELGQMLKQAGFSIKEVSGQEATRGLFFGAQSGRIIMLAERRNGTRRADSVPPDPE